MVATKNGDITRWGNVRSRPERGYCADISDLKRLLLLRREQSGNFPLLSSCMERSGSIPTNIFFVASHKAHPLMDLEPFSAVREYLGEVRVKAATAEAQKLKKNAVYAQFFASDLFLCGSRQASAYRSISEHPS